MWSPARYCTSPASCSGHDRSGRGYPVRTVPVSPRPHDHDAAEEEATSEWVRCQSASTTWSEGGSAFSAIGTVSLLATASRMEACTFWNARTSI